MKGAVELEEASFNRIFRKPKIGKCAKHLEGENIECSEIYGSPVGGTGLQLISFRVVNWISGVFKTGLITGYVASVLSVLDLRVNLSKATSAQKAASNMSPVPRSLLPHSYWEH